MNDEQKQAKKDAKRAAELANLKAPRAGTFAAGQKQPEPEPTAASKGLELSDLMYKPLDWLKEDPENAQDFEAAKNRRPGYWTDLQRDIEQNGILTPLLATPDGLLLQGHSRLTIARRLGIARVPVQIITGGLPTDPDALAMELRNRRRLDNLLRFELDDAARLAMLADIWPDFYTQPGKPGNPTFQSDHRDTIADNEPQPGKAGTPTFQSYHGDTITAAVIAKATGKSEAQIKRDRQTTLKATEKARLAGRERPTAQDIKQTKEEQNAARRGGKPALLLPPDLSGAIQMLAAWGIKSSESYRHGIRDCITVLGINHLLDTQTEDTLLAGITTTTERTREEKK